MHICERGIICDPKSTKCHTNQTHEGEITQEFMCFDNELRPLSLNILKFKIKTEINWANPKFKT